ncbi:MAG: hypothetical protein SGPRY_008066, partial [Prymnesium sp.]
ATSTLRRHSLHAMGASHFEQRVNVWRGWSCLLITLGSFFLVLANPRCFLFWEDDSAVFELTGTPGLLLSLSFTAYLAVDSAVAFFYRSHFRRPMGAVYLHHLFVGIGLLAFLLPSPPRGFFFYVWGEALTACRVLPPAPRARARHAVFAFRSVTKCIELTSDLEADSDVLAESETERKKIQCAASLVPLRKRGL